MPEAVRAGHILIREGTALSDSFQLETEPYSKGWQLLRKLDAYGLDRRARTLGWTFSLLAGEIKATAFSSDAARNAGTAVRRIMAKVGALKFNCLEITRVVEKRFLGVPYACVTAQSRHIQEGHVLFRRTKATSARKGPMSRRDLTLAGR